MNKMIPNSTQLPNLVIDEWMPYLSDTELRVLLIIIRQTYGWIEDVETGRRKEKDWIAYSQLIEKTGRQSQAIAQALKSLREKGLIEVLDQDGNSLKTREECIGKKLYYRINTSLKTKEVSPNLFDNQSLKIKDTKETNTKTLSSIKEDSKESTPKPRRKSQKKPSCPLLNGSPLREKYANGHSECVEHLISEEEDRGLKFINQAKQFQAIHKILRAGYDFYAIDKTITKVEKKYGKGSWDYTTLANWLEKGASSNAQEAER